MFKVNNKDTRTAAMVSLLLSTLFNEVCNEKQMAITIPGSIERHLNRSKLHFNNYGISVFVRNFRNFLNYLIRREERHNSGNINSSPYKLLDIRLFYHEQIWKSCWNCYEFWHFLNFRIKTRRQFPKWFLNFLTWL